MIRDRRLFGPGPSNPYPEATAALGLPLLGHLDPAFLELMDRHPAVRLGILMALTDRIRSDGDEPVA